MQNSELDRSTVPNPSQQKRIPATVDRCRAFPTVPCGRFGNGGTVRERSTVPEKYSPPTGAKPGTFPVGNGGTVNSPPPPILGGSEGGDGGA